MGASLGICTLFLTPLTIVDLPKKVPSGGAIASVVVLALVCTALAFIVFTVLIREAGTSKATVITYVNPVVAVALGVALLGESPGAGAVAGLLLILAGSWISTGGKLPPMMVGWVAERGLNPRKRRTEPAKAGWSPDRQASRNLVNEPG
jgi:drug/metabolite transporter (DMT)-like permease